MRSYINVNTKDNICILTINRPEALNALNEIVLRELEEAIGMVEKAGLAKVVIITGSGAKAFVAGADIGAMRDMNPEQAILFSKLGHRVFKRIEDSPLFIIAAVNGYALGGGCELAMACDMRIASENAKFGIPEVTLGLIPGFGGTQRLTRLIGLGNAMEMLATGTAITAKRAEKLGLVNHVTTSEELLSVSISMAEKVAKNGSSAIKIGKQAMKDGYDMDLKKALDYEATLFGVTFTTKDSEEGMSAFVEKRKAVFE